MKPADPPTLQEQRYAEVAQRFGAELGRFVAGYERDPAKRQELLQEVHLSLWRSLAAYRSECSLRTWTYRVAHNTCVLHAQRSVRFPDRMLVPLDEADLVADEGADVERIDRGLDLKRVLDLVHRLAPLDREVMLLYLEDLDAASIGEVTGLSAANVATKVRRIKALLAEKLARGGGGR